MKQPTAYYQDTHSPGRALTIDQLDYDPAYSYLDPRDAAGIRALQPGGTYQPEYVVEDDGPVWGLVTRLAEDTPVVALVKEGVVLGMGFTEEQARKDAAERKADVLGAEVYPGTLAALSGWHDDEGGLDVVSPAPDGTVRRIDVDDVAEEDKGTPNDPGWASDLWDIQAPPAPPTAATYAIHPADDLGAMPESLARSGLSLGEVGAWLDTNEDVGTFVILDEKDGKPACGHRWGLAGGALACECGREGCPDNVEPDVVVTRKG